ncbi:MAG: GDP-mannose 4,6-dehydratase, partial [Sodaliphilus sp.]|nr:GDP-mannose 4,6-dehydratase [Sodaliphilus sp.]
MKTYLVTGAAGFIGSNFVKYLLKKYGKDIQIIIVDALTYAGNLASIKDEIELDNVSFVKSD